MAVIDCLDSQGSPITLSRLMAITGLSRGGVVEIVAPLIKRGILIETMGKNSMGRGTARQFSIASGISGGDPD
ncbi:hypothetical protein O8B39_22445 [Agrobacterium rhizogenes]|nr:hypothetical protein [Rhizobium rhizogenes]